MLIEIEDETADKIRLAAALTGLTASEIVTRAITSLVASTPPTLTAGSTNGAAETNRGRDANLREVYAIYEGQRIDALYDRVTHRIDVVSGACSGSSYKSPSSAARAVVTAINSEVSPNRNGWTFWRVDGSGRFLQTMRKWTPTGLP